MRVLLRIEDPGAFLNGPGEPLLAELFRCRLCDETATAPLAYKLVDSLYKIVW